MSIGEGSNSPQNKIWNFPQILSNNGAPPDPFAGSHPNNKIFSKAVGVDEAPTDQVLFRESRNGQFR